MKTFFYFTVIALFFLILGIIVHAYMIQKKEEKQGFSFVSDYVDVQIEPEEKTFWQEVCSFFSNEEEDEDYRLKIDIKKQPER